MLFRSEGSGIVSRAGVNRQMYVLIHTFVYNRKLVTITYGVGGLSNNKSVKSEYEEYKPLFTKIGLSIILPDKWNGIDQEKMDYVSDSESINSIIYVIAILILAIAVFIIFKKRR